MIHVLDKDVFVLSSARTPIGRFNGSLSEFSAVELGGKAIEGALSRAGCSPSQVDMVAMGCVVSAGMGEAPAKQAALLAGVPPTVYSKTVESVCGSAMEAVVTTVDAILLGRVALGVAGGMESRTNAPYLLESRFFKGGAGYEKGSRLRLKKAGAYRFQFSENAGDQAELASIVDATAYDGLFWPAERKFMREYAVPFARARRISLEDVNEQAAWSHAKAREAQSRGYFEDEIVPVGNVSRDELASEEELKELKEIAQKDIASGFNTSIPADNGSAVVLAGAGFVSNHIRKPLARVLGFSRVDRPAAEFLDAPVEAIRTLLTGLESTGYSESQFEILEINEAFGIQMPVFQAAFPDKKINVNGGAIALGHPLGSAGTRLFTTLLHAMKRRGIRCGLVSICFGGGGAYALAMELVP